MSLTNIAARGAKARDKACKLSDATGLYLLVNPNGSKLCSTARDSALHTNHRAPGDYQWWTITAYTLPSGPVAKTAAPYRRSNGMTRE